jgi:hypothetical protein
MKSIVAKPVVIILPVFISCILRLPFIRASKLLLRFNPLSPSISISIDTYKCCLIDGITRLHLYMNQYILYIMVKTTIDIPDEKWKKFSIKVIEEYGGRKKNDVIEELIDKYLKEKEKGAK